MDFLYILGIVVIVEDNVNNINSHAFKGCTGLTSVIIGNSVTSIGRDVFENCSGLSAITIPESVTHIGGNLGNTIKEVTINSKLIEVDHNSYGSSLFIGYSKIIIGNNITKIGEMAFCYYTGSVIQNISISDSVVEIGEYAFRGCEELKEVTIGRGIKEIHKSVFTECSKLTSVYCKATTPPTVNYYIFDDSPVQNIYVPTESVDEYKATTNWKKYADIIVGYDFDE